jgi:hypothetical protein
MTAYGLDSRDSEQESVADFCEHGDEPSVMINVVNLLYQLNPH